MTQKSSIDPLAQQVIRFFVETYGPKLVRIVRRNVSMKSFGWFALAGALLTIPFAVMLVMKSTDERAKNKRYDTADYLSDDLA